MRLLQEYGPQTQTTKFGGGGGIRTHETGNPPSGFQDHLLKPLGHPSDPRFEYSDGASGT